MAVAAEVRSRSWLARRGRWRWGRAESCDCFLVGLNGRRSPRRTALAACVGAVREPGPGSGRSCNRCRTAREPFPWRLAPLPAGGRPGCRSRADRPSPTASRLRRQGWPGLPRRCRGSRASAKAGRRCGGVPPRRPPRAASGRPRGSWCHAPASRRPPPPAVRAPPPGQPRACHPPWFRAVPAPGPGTNGLSPSARCPRRSEGRCVRRIPRAAGTAEDGIGTTTAQRESRTFRGGRGA